MNDLRITAAATVEAAAGRPPRVSAVAYSGGVMKVSGWGFVALDLAGLNATAAVPILADHDSTLRGIAGQGTAESDGRTLALSGTLTVTTEAGGRIAALARDGFRFQASVGADAVPGRTEFVAAGGAVTLNGRTLTAPAGGLRVVRAATLREVSIVAIGADPDTAVSIAARRGTDMPTDTATADTTPATPIEAAAPPSDVGTAEAVRREERSRVAELETIFASAGNLDVSDLRGPAFAGELSADNVRRTVLERMRASRPAAPAPNGGGGTAVTREALEATLLIRAGFEEHAAGEYPARVMDAAHRMRAASLPDLCAAALRVEGRDVPHDRDDMIRAAFSTVSMPTALGNAANKAIEKTYREAPATWRAFAAVRSANDFKQHTSVRPSFVGELREVGLEGELTDMDLAESTFNWRVDTFGRKLKIDRRTIYNDDLSVLDEAAPAMARAGLRAINDLVFKTMLAAGGVHFTVGRGNLNAGAALSLASLSDAVRTVATQRDDQGNDLDIRPKVLLVPPELETTATQLLNSIELNRTGDQSPTGNPMKARLTPVVEPRLSNTDRYAGANADDWYVLAGPADVPVVVGFLRGMQTPKVEYFGMNHDVNTLSVAWRVYHDFGVAMGDHRAAVKNTAAG